MENILLGYSRVVAEVVFRHIRKELFERSFHPYVNGERLYPMQSEQQGTVGDLYPYAFYFHKLRSCIIVFERSTFFEDNFSAVNLTRRVDYVFIAEARAYRR